MINYKRIGYWRQYQNEKSDLPWPEEGRLSIETKQMIVDYLDNGTQEAAWLGWSTCRICGKSNGSTCLTDGYFVYPIGYSHYIKDHNIMPDLDLLAHVLTLEKNDKL